LDKHDGHRILVVDDERDIITVVKRGLEREGFYVDGFVDPAEALSRFKPDLYDLALLDIRMPRMNGFELYREVRKRDGKVKVCFMTAFEILPNEFKKVFPSIAMDNACLIRKPIRFDELVKRLNEEIHG
jgi:two-component system, OmpR family, response regulator ChvI